MIKSMTGFAQYTSISPQGRHRQRDAQLTVELRSVNHRFCEITVRAPKNMLIFEERVKRIIQEKAKRGRIDVFINMNTEIVAKKKLNVDIELAKAYIHATNHLKQELSVNGNITIQDLIMIQDLFHIEEEDSDLDQIADMLEQAVTMASIELLEMRKVEGRALEKDLKARIAEIESIIQQLEEIAPQVKTEYRQRLETRIRDFLDQRTEIDEARLLNEVAIFAEKSDINEELTRLSSHCQQFAHVLLAKEPVGRRLDFLIQEMNREINTIGSKANHIQISQYVVELKSSVEKMKEQVQNIE